MDDVTLSICIPTYNRAKFLDYLLNQIATECRFKFSYEVVISDNASTDDTPDVVQRYVAAGLPIDYCQHGANIGGGPNFLSVLHRGRGRYLIYVGDDDLLIPEALSNAVEFLNAHPEVRACYAPWELYDDLNKIPGPTFFKVDSDIIFEPGQDIDLFNFLISNHVFPEVAIYRADTVRNILAEGRFCYYAFAYLTNILAQGPVAFLKKPFYRAVTLSSVSGGRHQAGFDQAMTEWDAYRGGLEYMIFTFLRRSGRNLSREQRILFRDMIDYFVEMRMRVALRLWIERRDYLRAYEILCRIQFLAPNADLANEQVPSMPLLVAVQTLARLANSIAGIDRVVLSGVKDGRSLAELLNELGLEQRITVSGAPTSPSQETAVRSLVFLAEEDERDSFLRRGYLPGLIISEAELLSGIYIS